MAALGHKHSRGSHSLRECMQSVWRAHSGQALTRGFGERCNREERQQLLRLCRAPLTAVNRLRARMSGLLVCLRHADQLVCLRHADNQGQAATRDLDCSRGDVTGQPSSATECWMSSMPLIGTPSSARGMHRVFGGGRGGVCVCCVCLGGEPSSCSQWQAGNSSTGKVQTQVTAGSSQDSVQQVQTVLGPCV